MKWFRRATATEDELAVVATLLPEHDSRSQQLISQVRKGPIRRDVVEDCYTLVLEHTTEDLLLDLEEDVSSPWIEVLTAQGDQVEFRLELRRGGFFGALRGRALGDRWPKRWQLSGDALRSLNSRRLVLPPLSDTSDCVGRLRPWLPDPPLSIRCRPGASEHEIRRVESEEGTPLPGELRRLLGQSNGVSIDGWEVFDASSLHVVELERAQFWLVGQRPLSQPELLILGSLDDRYAVIPIDGHPSDAVWDSDLARCLQRLVT